MCVPVSACAVCVCVFVGTAAGVRVCLSEKHKRGSEKRGNDEQQQKHSLSPFSFVRRGHRCHPLPLLTMAAPTGGVAPEHAAFEAVITALLSPDNAARAAGEARFAEARASPDACVRGLLAVLTTSAELDARGLCAVLLRKVRDWRESVDLRRVGPPTRHTRVPGARCRPPAVPVIGGGHGWWGDRVARGWAGAIQAATAGVASAQTFRSTHPSPLSPQVLTKDTPSLWPSLSADTQTAVKAGLLACVQNDAQRTTTHKVCVWEEREEGLSRPAPLSASPTHPPHTLPLGL